tara:strand:+ start:1103 stop:1546 length:444 start_codon:yes stop_codon:yes gene_type:complete
MEKKKNEMTLIPDIKVMHFEPDEEDRLPELKIEDGPRYRNKTIPELKEMAKGFGLKVSGTRIELIHRIADETVRINAEKKKDNQAANFELIEGIRTSIGVNEVKLKQVKEARFALVKEEDEIEAKLNQLRLTLATLEETLDVPDIKY